MQRSSRAFLCFENHVGTLKTTTLEAQIPQNTFKTNTFHLSKLIILLSLSQFYFLNNWEVIQNST
jgi:hypothetical protein